MTLVDELYSKIDEGRKGKNTGLKTGLHKLDWYTGGFQKSIYKLWYGQSGSGKSSVVIFSELYRTLKDYPDYPLLHVYFSLEMSSSVLLAKLLSLYLFETYGIELSYMDLMSVRTPISEDIYSYIQRSKYWLESISSKLIIFDKQLSSDSFYSSMMEILKQYGSFDKSEDGRRTIYIPNNDKLIINVIIDHAGLISPSKGRSKKEEIDLLSVYCVRFRELCGISIDFIMQENRNAGNIDRVKLNATEPTLDDAKESGGPINDCNIAIAVYYPIKYQLKSYRGYRVLDDKNTGVVGLGSAIRSLLLLKNRFGTANKVFPVGFQGSIGRFVELPKPELIDYNLYQNWKDDKYEDKSEKDETDTNCSVENKSKIQYSF